MPAPSEHPGFCSRLRGIRRELYGEAGAPALAEALGIPSSTWANYEKGVTIPGPVLLRLLCLHDIEPRWLLTGEGDAFRARPETSGRRGSI